MIFHFNVINVVSGLHPVHAKLGLPEDGQVLDVIDGGRLDI